MIVRIHSGADDEVGAADVAVVAKVDAADVNEADVDAADGDSDSTCSSSLPRIFWLASLQRRFSCASTGSLSSRNSHSFLRSLEKLISAFRFLLASSCFSKLVLASVSSFLEGDSLAPPARALIRRSMSVSRTCTCELLTFQ